MLGEGITALLDEIEALRVDPKLHEGAPPHPWDTEWFIAITIYGDRVVLKELPDEYTYDYTTADGTYMLKSNVAKWMQFPDSQFVDYTARQKETP